MRITDLTVEGFGVWQGLAMNDLTDQLTVFFGENEAGKTTLLHFVRSILYGFSPERRARYLPPLGGGRAGGSVSICGPQGKFQFRRYADDRNGGPGEVEVIAADGTVQGRHQLAVLLGGIDEEIYNNVFAVGLHEIQELATLDDTEAAQQLYDLTAGLDRVSLVEVMRELEASRNRILSSGDDPSQVTRLMEQRSRIQTEIDQLRSASREWSQLAGQHLAAQREIADLESGVGRLEHRAKIIELARSVRQRWDRRKALADQLAALGPLPQLPAGSIETLDRLGGQIEKHRRRCRELKQQRRALAEQASNLAVNEALWRQAPRIEAVGEQQQWIASIQQQVAQLEEEIELVEMELADERKRRGFGDEASAAARLPDISSRSMAALRQPARRIREARQQTEQARRKIESCRQESDAAKREIEDALSRRGQRDLTDALERAGESVSQLRRRTQLDERIEQLDQHRTELQEQGQTLVQRQVLPVWVLAALGGLFMLGVVLILTGLFGGAFALTAGAGWALALLGLGGTAAAVATKYLLEWSAARRLETCKSQSELLQLQIERTRQERDELDRSLPKAGGMLGERLRTAEAELTALEELLPLQGRLSAAKQEIETAKRQAAESSRAMKTAVAHWRDALRSLGLPEGLSPKQIRELAGSRETLQELQRRLDSRYEELEQRQRELAALTGRIVQLAAEASLPADTDRPVELIQQLMQELQRQEQFVKQRDGLSRQAKKLHREQSQRARRGRKLLRHQRMLMQQAGVTDAQQFRELAARHAHAKQLRESHDALTLEINAAIESVCTEQELARHLNDHSDEQLDATMEELVTGYDAMERKLKTLYERRGRLAEQMNAMTGDRRLAELQLELGCIEQRLAEAVQKWQTLAVTGLLLQRIRTLYETERQPETLQQASTYLNRLTEGRYTRVWTPLGEEVLRVDDAAGQSLPLEVLSRGTREQVFLSLRLALAAGYARRGILLPLVLDDVLVNFDAARAKAAAVVLRDFAKAGHQLFVFTCHEHIMKLFKAMKVEIRRLPDRASLAKQTAEEKPKKPKRRSKPVEPAPAVVEVEESEPVEVEEIQQEIEEEIPEEEEVVVEEEEEIEDELDEEEDVYDELEEEEDEPEEEAAELEDEEDEWEEEEDELEDETDELEDEEDEWEEEEDELEEESDELEEASEDLEDEEDQYEEEEDEAGEWVEVDEWVEDEPDAEAA